MEGNELARRFIDAYIKRVELHREKKRLNEMIHSKMIEQYSIKKAIELNKKTDEPDQPKPPDQTVMFGTGIHRLSLVSIGSLPTENLDRFHTEAAIYPIGYTCRKKYWIHNSYKKKAKDKIVYVCNVDEERGPIITADDGREWSGPGMWEEFTESVENMCEYKNLDEFFGFSNPALIKKIESLGDISVFKRYIPWSKRNKVQGN